MLKKGLRRLQTRNAEIECDRIEASTKSVLSMIANDGEQTYLRLLPPSCQRYHRNLLVQLIKSK